jgi:hypothetical protein
MEIFSVLEYGALSVMTFDEVNRVIKKGDLTRLRNELEGGLNPNLSNRYSWTLLMAAAMATQASECSSSKRALIWTRGTIFGKRRYRSQRTPGIRPSSDCCWRVVHLWNATLLEII